LFREDYYQIKVEGAISTEVREQFKGLTVDGKEGVTTISGAIKDQMMLVALLGEIRKGLLIGWAYKANQLISFLTLGFIFVVIVFFMTGGTLDPVRIAPAIIGYLTWMYVVAVLGDLAFGLRAEMSAGTLEQLAMSPAPVGLLLTARVIVNIIVTTIEVILMAILVLVIFDIHINWSIDVLPILLLTLVGVLGFGFMIAGVVLIFKQIESFINLFNNLLAFLNGTFLPVSAMPGWLAAIAMAIPSTSGIIVIRKLMLDGKSLTDTWRDGSLVGLAINSVCYLLIGWIIFVVCERVAKRRGSLGQY